jgi:hypothetical protein
VADSSYPGVPRWLKLLGIVVIVFVLLLGILRLAGHDPMAHHRLGSTPAADDGR